MRAPDPDLPASDQAGFRTHPFLSVAITLALRLSELGIGGFRCLESAFAL